MPWLTQPPNRRWRFAWYYSVIDLLLLERGLSVLPFVYFTEASNQSGLRVSTNRRSLSESLSIR